jgi:hypothetical protein
MSAAATAAAGVPRGVQTELVLVLATMALGRIQRVIR